jgi:hypothetical protein
MVDRLRALLDHPLDPSAARAILVLASAILLGFTAVFVIAASQPERPASPERSRSVESAATPAPPPTTAVEPPAATSPLPGGLRQDPQDVKGSAAARRAARAVRSHRALQHVPYRRGNLAIILVGAKGHRAVLRVTAPTRAAAQHGWRVFLRHFRDRGSAYIARFVVRDSGAKR